MTWKTIKIHQRDYELVMQLRQCLTAHGSQHLPEAAQAALREGATIGAIVGAGLAVLRGAAGPEPGSPPKRRRP